MKCTKNPMLLPILRTRKSDPLAVKRRANATNKEIRRKNKERAELHELIVATGPRPKIVLVPPPRKPKPAPKLSAGEFLERREEFEQVPKECADDSIEVTSLSMLAVLADESQKQIYLRTSRTMGKQDIVNLARILKRDGTCIIVHP